MSWIFQKQGPINHYNPRSHLGTQPIRVIHHMLIYMFQRTNAEFFSELLKQIQDGKLSNELNLVYAEESIRIGDGSLRTPRINRESRRIELHETFLAYLWCCTYAIFVRYSETIDYPRVNRENGKITHPINANNINQAADLFAYAKYLIADFKPWDKDALPNPESYLAEKRDYVEQTNLFYTEAVKFILCHEYTHLKLHIDQIDENTTNSHYLAFEIEADNNAIDMMKRGITYTDLPLAIAQRLAAETGIVFGILSMFFFRVETDGKKHPNAEDRLTSALERLHLDNEAFAWGIACVGLQMWDEQFGLDLVWDNNSISYKEQYFKIIKQIKERQA